MNTTPLCPITPARLDQLMAEIFFAGRDARSQEYQAGCRAALSRRLGGPAVRNPHIAGTAAADAWWAGWDEGRSFTELYQLQCGTYQAARDAVDAAVTGRWGLEQLQGQLEVAVKAVVPTSPEAPQRETASRDGAEA